MSRAGPSTGRDRPTSLTSAITTVSINAVKTYSSSMWRRRWTPPAATASSIRQEIPADWTRLELPDLERHLAAALPLGGEGRP